MLNTYFVYLELGWIHAYLCVFACLRRQATLSHSHESRHTSTHSSSVYLSRLPRLRHQPQDGRLAQRHHLLIPLSLVSRVIRVLVALPALDVRAPTR